jgi:hypothetical protein
MSAINATTRGFTVSTGQKTGGEIPIMRAPTKPSIYKRKTPKARFHPYYYPAYLT